MSFFELPPASPEPPERPKQPEWVEPAENVMGAPFPLSAVVARTDRVGIQIYAGLAYPSGFEFRFSLAWRAERTRATDPIHAWHELRRGGEIPPEVLRFGIEDADGGRGTVFGRPFRGPDEPTPSGPLLIQRGGGGGMHRWDMRFWCWPLPPAGPFSFVVEWPSESIELTRVEIDTAPIREAAGRAVELWPDDDARNPGGGWARYA